MVMRTSEQVRAAARARGTAEAVKFIVQSALGRDAAEEGENLLEKLADAAGIDRESVIRALSVSRRLGQLAGSQATPAEREAAWKRLEQERGADVRLRFGIAAMLGAPGTRDLLKSFLRVEEVLESHSPVDHARDHPAVRALALTVEKSGPPRASGETAEHGGE